MAASWKLDGSYFETCNCEAACPCNFGSPPTDGQCTVLIAWHVERGDYDGTKLDGLNAAMVAHAPGHMLQTKWKAALYLDERADEAQRNALGTILGGQAGGLPAQVAPLIGEVLGVAPARIVFEADGRMRRVTVGSAGEAEIAAIDGGDGGDATITNPPINVSPGQPLVVARSRRYRFADHGLAVEVSGKNGYYAPFSYSP